MLVRIMFINFFTGFFCIRFPETMLEPATKQLYIDWLTKDFGSVKKIEVIMSNMHVLIYRNTVLKLHNSLRAHNLIVQVFNLKESAFFST